MIVSCPDCKQDNLIPKLSIATQTHTLAVTKILKTANIYIIVMCPHILHHLPLPPHTLGTDIFTRLQRLSTRKRREEEEPHQENPERHPKVSKKGLWEDV